MPRSSDRRAAQGTMDASWHHQICRCLESANELFSKWNSRPCPVGRFRACRGSIIARYSDRSPRLKRLSDPPRLRPTSSPVALFDGFASAAEVKVRFSPF